MWNSVKHFQVQRVAVRSRELEAERGLNTIHTAILFQIESLHDSVSYGIVQSKWASEFFHQSFSESRLGNHALLSALRLRQEQIEFLGEGESGKSENAVAVLLQFYWNKMFQRPCPFWALPTCLGCTWQSETTPGVVRCHALPCDGAQQISLSDLFESEIPLISWWNLSLSSWFVRKQKKDIIEGLLKLLSVENQHPVTVSQTQAVK